MVMRRASGILRAEISSVNIRPPAAELGRSVDQQRTMSNPAGALTCLLTLVACVPTVRREATPQRVVAALATVRGKFAEVGDGAFVLLPATPADDSLLRNAAALDRAAVPALIECLADTAPALVEYAGAPTSIGAVCFWALISTRFVQDRIARGSDPNPANLGWVNYRAIESQQQQRARAEWHAWFERQTAQ